MNLPNQLTIMRVLLVPMMILFLLMESFKYNFLFAGIIFAIAAITDHLDGLIARKYKLITNFGKFADPLADKILVISALICFVQLQFISCVPVVIIIFREFMVTSVRLVASNNNKVIAANMWGKVKTVSQIIAVLVVILSTMCVWLKLYGELAVWLSAIITLISGLVYVMDNKKFISMQ